MRTVTLTVAAIAHNTAREAIRNKVLYSILMFAFIMVGIAAILGAASIGDEMKFIKDFSLLSISLFGVISTVVLGVNLLHKELGKKTIVNLLSKPVARWQFLLGKYCGLLVTLVLLTGVMTAVLLLGVRFLEGQIDWHLLLATSAIAMELALLLAVALLFSAIVVTPTLAGMFTAATFVAGRCASHLYYFSDPAQPAYVGRPLTALYYLLPHLYRFWIADRVVYHDALSGLYLFNLGLYASAYAGLLLLVSLAFFNRRDFS